MPNTPLNTADKRAELRKAALEYHEFPTPGKLAIAATKQLANQRDLALAYSPGVAAHVKKLSKTRTTLLNTRHAATWWQSSPTARLFWDWVTLARWPPSR